MTSVKKTSREVLRDMERELFGETIDVPWEDVLDHGDACPETLHQIQEPRTHDVGDRA